VLRGWKHKCGSHPSTPTCADVTQVCPVESLCQLDDCLIVDVATLGQLGRMDLQRA
jgi:hypothetical protein